MNSISVLEKEDQDQLKDENALVINKKIDIVFKDKIERISLIQPPHFPEEMLDLKIAKNKRYYNFPPYGLGLLSTNLISRGYQVSILDFNMEGLIGTGTGRTYEDFQRQIPEPVKPLFDRLRTYCMSLDEKVIEDVRMHRIVFCKTMTFRWFADIEPSQSSIIIKIQKERKVEPKILEVNPEQELSKVESLLKDAFMTIR